MRLAGLHLAAESLVTLLVVGLVAGWIAAKFVQGHGLGIVGDIVVGVIGAFIGHWVLPQLGIHLGTGLALSILNAAIGAIILLLLVRFIRRI